MKLFIQSFIAFLFITATIVSVYVCITDLRAELASANAALEISANEIADLEDRIEADFNAARAADKLIIGYVNVVNDMQSERRETQVAIADQNAEFARVVSELKASAAQDLEDARVATVKAVADARVDAVRTHLAGQVEAARAAYAKANAIRLKGNTSIRQKQVGETAAVLRLALQQQKESPVLLGSL